MANFLATTETRADWVDPNAEQLAPYDSAARRRFFKVLPPRWLTAFVIHAVLIDIGFLLAIYYVTALQKNPPPPPPSIEVSLLPGDPGEDKPLGVGNDDLEPGVEEFFEIDVPQLADAVAAVSDAPAQYRGMLAALEGTGAEMGKGRGMGSLDGGGGGGGGGRPYDRWSIEYAADDMGTYIEQLNAFGVQIGAVHKVLDQIELIIDLGSRPQTRPQRRSEEKRVYFTHSSGKLRAIDMRIAKQAGINTTGKIMVQFYRPETSQKLAELEAAEAQKRGIELKRIRRTIFKVRSAGSGFEFYVADLQPK